MAELTLQSMAIGTVLFIFIAIFAGGIMIAFDDNYNVPLDSNTPNLTAIYSPYEAEFEDYKDDAEDAGEDVRATDTDDQGLTAALRQLNRIMTIRSQISDINKDTEEVLWFVPTPVWSMISIIIGIIIVTIGIGFWWRYRKGLV